MNAKEEQSAHQQVAISQRALGEELPVLFGELIDHCVLAGFFGSLKAAHLQKVINMLTEKMDNADNEWIILDLSNVATVDFPMSKHLVHFNRLLQFMGMKVIFCGISYSVAQSLITAGVELNGVAIEKNLKQALQVVFKMQGFQVLKAGRSRF